MKRCYCCRLDKPIEAYSKNASKYDGLASACKSCFKIYQKEWRKTEKGKESNKRISKRYAEKYPDRVKAINQKACKKYYENNKEFKKKANNNWRLSNLERVKKLIKDHQKTNPEYWREKSKRYNARRRNATPKWLTKDQLKLIKNIYREASRISKETGIKHEVDHIIPLQGELVSGLHVPWNLQVLTAQNNKEKHNKLAA